MHLCYVWCKIYLCTLALTQNVHVRNYVRSHLIWNSWFYSKKIYQIIVVDIRRLMTLFRRELYVWGNWKSLLTFICPTWWPSDHNTQRLFSFLIWDFQTNYLYVHAIFPKFGMYMQFLPSPSSNNCDNIFPQMTEERPLSPHIWIVFVTFQKPA